MFAAARKQLLFPTSVTYCNTGTLGASRHFVVDAMNRGVEKLESELPDWPIFQPDGEPLIGCQQLKEVRALFAEFIGDHGSQIRLTGQMRDFITFRLILHVKDKSNISSRLRDEIESVGGSIVEIPRSGG